MRSSKGTYNSKDSQNWKPKTTIEGHGGEASVDCRLLTGLVVLSEPHRSEHSSLGHPNKHCQRFVDAIISIPAPDWSNESSNSKMSLTRNSNRFSNVERY